MRWLTVCSVTNVDSNGGSISVEFWAQDLSDFYGGLLLPDKYLLFERFKNNSPCKNTKEKKMK